MTSLWRVACTALGGGALALMLAACSPTFNWREVRADDSELLVMLPCKPDRASRGAALLGPGQPELPMTMFGCESGGHLFAVAGVTLPSAGDAPHVLAAWQAAALRQMGAGAGAERAFTVRRASADAPALTGRLVVARGSGAQPVTSHALYFSHGSDAWQAVVLAAQADDEVLDTFFTGLRLP